MLPRLGSKLISRWIVVTLVVSIVAAVDGGWVARALALAPSRIWRGELWRLVTWPLVETHPWSLVVTCAAIYKLGGELAVRWGDRRLLRYVVHVTIVAGVGASVLAAVAGASQLWRVGGWAIDNALVIAWARQFPNAGLVMAGLVPLRGQMLINVTIGVAVLFAIYFGPVWMAPELFACGAAAVYPIALLRG